MIEIQASGEKCLGDFTFDFYWQHQGSRLDKDQTVSGISSAKMVEALRQGETVRIIGDVGSRLGSSLGVDLIRLGGKGGPIETTGKIVVDGDVGSHMGISMLRGSIYVSGRVASPLGKRDRGRKRSDRIQKVRLDNRSSGKRLNGPGSKRSGQTWFDHT